MPSRHLCHFDNSRHQSTNLRTVESAQLFDVVIVTQLFDVVIVTQLFDVVIVTQLFDVVIVT